MVNKTETEYVIFTVFLIGVIAAIYYLISVMTAELDQTVILEKTILVGIIVSILIILAILLLKEIKLRDQVNMLSQSGASRPSGRRTAKDVKKDMMRLYRDMGALKIVYQDNIIDKATYDREQEELDKKIEELKKEHDKLKKK